MRIRPLRTARDEQGMGSTVTMHDGYHAAYKIIVCHVVRHSRPEFNKDLCFLFYA